MTVAAGIEIGTGGSAQSLAPAKAQGVGAAPTDVSSSAASFRSSWQQLLDSLGSGLDGDSAQATEGNTTLAGSGDAQSATAGTAPVPSLPPTTGTALMRGLGKVQENKTAVASATMSAAGFRSGASVLKKAPEIEAQAAAGETQESTVQTRSGESTGGTRSAHSAKNAKAESASTASSEQASATTDSISPLLPMSAHPIAPTVAGEAPVSETAKDPTDPDTAPLVAGGAGLVGQTASVLGTKGQTDDLHAGAVAGGRSAPASRETQLEATKSQQPTASSGINDVTSDHAPDSTEASGSSVRKSDSTSTEFSAPEPVSTVQGKSLAPSVQGYEQAQSAGTDAFAVAAGSGQQQGAEALADAAKSPNSQSLATPSLGRKPGVASAGRTEESTITRTAQASEPVPSMLHKDLTATGQASWTAQDGAGLVRDQAGSLGGTAVSGAGTSTTSTTSTQSSATHEAFSALDAGTLPVTPTWIHAGARRAEAGFQDPSLGWVGVRADSSGGSVHASLVPGSADAAQTLSGHLAGLNAYLAEQHTSIATVTMAAFEEQPAAYAMEQGMGQSMNQNQGMGQGSGTGQQFAPAASEPASSSTASTVLAASTGGSVLGNSLGGAHISVMA